MKNDVLLINSPIFDEKQILKENYLPPIGLGYIASNLIQHNISTAIIDCVYENLTVKEIVEYLNKTQPKFTGINIFSINQGLVRQIIEKYKGKTTWLIGAKTVQSLYKEFPLYNTLNKIVGVIGEADLIAKDIVEDRVKQAPIFTQGNIIIYSVNKDSVYYPSNISDLTLDRSLFVNRIAVNPYGLIEDVLVASRGCVYNCAFCGAARSLNKDVTPRVRTVESLKEEIKQIVKNNASIKCIRMLDDLFLLNRKSIEDALRIFAEFDLKWRAMAHVNTFKNNLDLVTLLKDSGCIELEIGIESGNDEIRKMIKKEGTISEAKNIIKGLLDKGINVKGYFMYGFPGETKEQMAESLSVAKELYSYSITTEAKFKTSAFQFRPYHGTELFKRLQLDVNTKYQSISGQIQMKGRKQFNFMSGNYSKCSQEEVDQFVIMANSLNKSHKKILLRSNQILDNLCDVMFVGISNKDNRGDVLQAFDYSTNSGKILKLIEETNPNVKFYKTNLVKFVPKDASGKICYPSKLHIKEAMGDLVEEIKQRQPKVVFAMGAMVNQSLCAEKELAGVNIEKVEHPSYIAVYKRKTTNEYVSKISNIIDKYCGASSEATDEHLDPRK